jgi:CheY-like chemotaxis protein
MDNVTKINYLAKNFTILVVEDSAVLQKQIVTFLSKFFTTVYSANDGDDGLNQYLKYKPDIVLCDLIMPKLDGLDLIEQIMKLDPLAKIIIISAHLDTNYLLRAFHLGVKDFVPKPINNELLISGLVRVLNELKKEFIKSNDIPQKHFENKFIKELNIIQEKNIKVNLINHYRGIPIIHDGYIIDFNNNKIELRTNELQSIVIQKQKQTLIDSELLSKEIYAKFDYIDSKTNHIFLHNAQYVDNSVKQRGKLRVEPDDSFKFIINDKHGNIKAKVVDCSVKAICIEVTNLPQDYEVGKKIAISIAFEMKHSHTFDIKNNEHIGAYATIFKILQHESEIRLILNLELNKGDEELLGEYIYQREITLIKELKNLIKKA